MPDENGYPTPDELEKVRTWKVPEESVMDLVNFLQEIWWQPDWGFHLYEGKHRFLDHPCMVLELYTAGWPGNEDIIEALRCNDMQNFFWIFYWEASRRGGHYYFEIPMDLWKGNNSDKSKTTLSRR